MGEGGGIRMGLADVHRGGPWRTPGGPAVGEGVGCPWDSSTYMWAAFGGHLKVLKWTITNGCPYNEHNFSNISNPDFHEWFGEYKSNNF